ncbi:hypothetical protein [Kitasatospora sp. NPDC096140]|uniref:hypothetical protein n=1 Tax=Kitasatospora sp. NPDC096140 TaxID=3155425 RepID=UPI00331BDFAF
MAHQAISGNLPHVGGTSVRGLGDPDRATLGDGLVHLTWPNHLGVQELQQGGRPVGWIEEYDVQRGIWTALIDSSLVANAASGEPLRVQFP